MTGSVKPSMLVWPIFAKPPWSLVLMIAVPFVAIVISAWISDPVASVAMNESIRITTTTIALITPISTPAPRPSSDRGQERHADREEVRGDHAGQRHRVGKRQIEDPSGQRES